MNVFKYIVLKVKELFAKRPVVEVVVNEEVFENYQVQELPKPKHYPAMPPVKPARKERKPHEKATKKQIDRIYTLVKRGKSVNAIAKDVGLPHQNVRYYVKKFGG